MISFHTKKRLPSFDVSEFGLFSRGTIEFAHCSKHNFTYWTTLLCWFPFCEHNWKSCMMLTSACLIKFNDTKTTYSSLLCWIILEPMSLRNIGWHSWLTVYTKMVLIRIELPLNGVEYQVYGFDLATKLLH